MKSNLQRADELLKSVKPRDYDPPERPRLPAHADFAHLSEAEFAACEASARDTFARLVNHPDFEGVDPEEIAITAFQIVEEKILTQQSRRPGV